MRIGLLVDGLTVARWQELALLAIADEAEFCVYNATAAPSGKRRLRHLPYYLLNLFTVRNSMTSQRPLPDGLRIAKVTHFEAGRSGAWQQLPDSLLDQIRTDRPDVIVKFGMGLLKVPGEERLPVPILSYHHGDPHLFRGRPAGFYELLQDRPVMGQVVQRLTNRLDSGEILALGETKVVPHSYRATLVEAYRHSHLLLREAIANALAGTPLGAGGAGPNYTLPTTSKVARVVAKTTARTVSRLLYGALVEKNWRVVVAPALPGLSLPEAEHWSEIATPPGYNFLADPFFHPDDGLLVEAMNARSGCGEIVHLLPDGARKLSAPGGHHSYPATYREKQRWFLVPEISEWSPQRAFELRPTGLGAGVLLQLPRGVRLLDPTLHQQDGTVYLFGNDASEGPSALRLWFADSLDSPFIEHPCSPIRLSPMGSRMGGALFQDGGRTIRVGQDLRGSYGDGVAFFHVVELGREAYREEPIGELKLAKAKGPHTINFARGSVTFDYYSDRFSILAGFRRLKQRWARNA